MPDHGSSTNIIVTSVSYRDVIKFSNAISIENNNKGAAPR